MPDETKGSIRRTSKTGKILASPTHRKLTPTHIKSTGSSPIKRINKFTRNQFRSFDDEKMDQMSVDDAHIHDHYRKVIDELKQMHEDQVKRMQYKLQSLKGSPTDDEYLVSKYLMCFAQLPTPSTRTKMSAFEIISLLFCQNGFKTPKTN